MSLLSRLWKSVKSPFSKNSSSTAVQKQFYEQDLNEAFKMFPLKRPSNTKGMVVKRVLPPCSITAKTEITAMEMLWRKLPFINANRDADVIEADYLRALRSTTSIYNEHFGRDNIDIMFPKLMYSPEERAACFSFTPVIFEEKQKEAAQKSEVKDLLLPFYSKAANTEPTDQVYLSSTSNSDLTTTTTAAQKEQNLLRRLTLHEYATINKSEYVDMYNKQFKRQERALKARQSTRK